MEKKLRVGVIGCGWVSQNRHIPSYKLNPKCQIVAVADRRKDIANKVSTGFKIPKAYDDIDLFFEKEELDLVSVCTPPWSHSEYSLKSIERGWHVITEKPMAMNIDEADKMIVMAHEKNRKLSVCHNFLFSNTVQAADLMIKNGEVGKIRNVIAIQLGSPNRRLPDWYNKLPGGLFYDESSHILYLMDHFIPDFKVISATATLGDPNLPQQVSQIHADVTTKEASGSMTMIFNSPLSEWQILIIGSKKVLCLDIFRDILITLGSDKGHTPYDVLKTSLSAINQELKGVVHSGIGLYRGKLLFGHDKLINGFVDSIVKDREPPVTTEEGRNIVRLQHEIIKQCRIN